MSIEEAEYPEEELSKFVKDEPQEPARFEAGPASDVGMTAAGVPTGVAANASIQMGGDDSISGVTKKVVKIKRRNKVKVSLGNTQQQKLRRHISERRWTLYNWYRHLHWRNITLTILIPLVGAVISFAVNPDVHRSTLKFTALCYVLTCLSVNVGYHRYYAHRSFTMNSTVLNLFLLVNGATGGVGNAKWWSCAHRAHHRYCDTDRDPHNSRKGFLYCHIGWMIVRHHPKVQAAIKESEYDDMNDDPLLNWQYENYLKLYLVFGILVPAVVCGWLWNDFIGGVLYAGIIKTICVQHTFFFVNSLCHSKHCCGSQPFDDRKSPRNNFLLDLITFGEGHHNFHHEFPSDYRNGIHWYNLDATKWTIAILYQVGLVSELKKTPSTAIRQLYIQHQQTLIDRKRAKLNWGIPIANLPKLAPADFRKLVQQNPTKALVVVSGIVHDVTSFVDSHPGGVGLIRASIGKDATSAFNGAVYDHTNAAHNLLATMRVAVIKGIDSEQLVWRQQQRENKEVPIKQDSEGKRIVRSGEQVTIVKAHSTTAGAA